MRRLGGGMVVCHLQDCGRTGVFVYREAPHAGGRKEGGGLGHSPGLLALVYPSSD